MGGDRLSSFVWWGYEGGTVLPSRAIVGILAVSAVWLVACGSGSSGDLQQRWDRASSELSEATGAYMALSQETPPESEALLPVMREMLTRSEPLLAELETAYQDWSAVTDQVLASGSLEPSEAQVAREMQSAFGPWLEDLREQQRIGGGCVRDAGDDEARFWSCWTDMMSTHGGEWAANVERVQSAWVATGGGTS